MNVSVLNSPPNADAGLPHSLTVGVSHTHTGANASDVDANLSSYSWTWAPSPSACPSSCPPLSLASGVISGTLDSPSGPEYTPNVAGSYTLRLTVFDTVGGPPPAPTRGGSPNNPPGFPSPPLLPLSFLFFFFFNDTATTEIYTLSLHDALPI